MRNKGDKEKEELILDDEFLKQCGKIFAHDLIRYQENGGDMENITANKVYKFLEELEKQSNEEGFK